MEIIYSSLHGFIRNHDDDQLPVGLLTQLVEHCAGIAKVMGANPEQAWFFSRSHFHYCLNSVHYCEDRFYIYIHKWMSKGVGYLIIKQITGLLDNKARNFLT